ncbi:Amidohydrolase 3 [Coriobacterium glomerans PW2]|uniref:Amidohydrolase 3 n=1 Tax=Coriobacterium glomerans (strain ATCC 49209 / DSM 20642 / JCM 10262 / PW2) TaxID=700015 RepID=F2N7K2_CORGP|nr:amidohydrolase family protein [Coriobacterium glomerans]AEB06818.1 Amidohydrolase 3 [Coriobacterium glomerans PW2]
MRKRKLVLLSRCVFTGTQEQPFNGFVSLCGNLIEAVGPAAEAPSFIAAADETRDLGNCTLMPGLIDVHTFFSGWLLRRLGADCAPATDAEQIIQSLKCWAADHERSMAAIGHDLPNDLLQGDGRTTLETALEEGFGDKPAVVFASNGTTCAMNAAAVSRYGFSPECCYSEKLWRLIAECLALPEAGSVYSKYMRMLNARGVTSIKEMSFDDYYGFATEMKKKEDDDDLSIRVSMMSQPVGRGLDLAYARDAQQRFSGSFVRFSGFNRMIDRGVAAGLAEMIQPYEKSAVAGAAGRTVIENPDWPLIEQEVRAGDAEGFRFSLHCQGDGAVRHTVGLLDSLTKNSAGRLRCRHAITDLENTDPRDLVRFGRMGGICEVYPQIFMLDPREECVAMMRRQIGEQRLRRSWNRRAMFDSGCVVCCGTDLPLLLPDIGDSIYCACGGRFADGRSFNSQNTCSISELLGAWTAGGAYDLEREHDIGTLESGKLADICVLDRNLFALDSTAAREARIVLTISDGRIVYES